MKKLGQKMGYDKCAIINQSIKSSRGNVGKNILLDKKVLDPKLAKTKGAPKRIKGGIERGRKRTSSGKVKKVRIYCFAGIFISPNFLKIFIFKMISHCYFYDVVM